MQYRKSCVTESLEARRLFAGIGMANGVLVIIGSGITPNTIVVGLTPDHASINATLSFPSRRGDFNFNKTFPLARAKLLLIRTGVKNDSITIDQTNGSFLVWARILSGPGDDHIVAGDERDTINGGWGSDLIDAGGGDDSITGDYGNDTIFGGAGNDWINGSFGNDYIDGGDGNDVLLGTYGNDTLVGGAGRDGMVGGAGLDYLSGGDGDDTLMDGRGRDTLYGDAGSDVFRDFGLRLNPVNDYTAGTDIFKRLPPPSSNSTSIFDDVLNQFLPFG